MPQVSLYWARRNAQMLPRGLFPHQQLAYLLKAPRLLRLYKPAKKLSRSGRGAGTFGGHGLRIFSLLLAFLLVAHWVACTWFALGMSLLDECDECSWVDDQSISRDTSIAKVRGAPGGGGAFFVSRNHTTCRARRVSGFVARRRTLREHVMSSPTSGLRFELHRARPSGLGLVSAMLCPVRCCGRCQLNASRPLRVTL